MAADSRGGTLFANWWDRYYEKASGKFAVAWSAAEPTTTPRGLADRARAVQSFADALRRGQQSITAGPTSPGARCTAFARETSTCRSAAARHDGLLSRAGVSQDADGKLVANSGDSFVFAVEFSQPPKAYTVRGLQPKRRRRLAALQRPGPALLGQQDEARRVYRRRDPGPIAQDLPSRAGVSPGGAANPSA